MKFNREINSESGRAFSWFFAFFSLVLMALAFGAGMPWYFCFLFIAFSLLCVTSIIDLQKYRFREGEILYFRRCRRRRVRVSQAKILLLTEYCGPLRRNGAKTYEVKVRPGEKEKRSRMYILLLDTEEIGLLGKCATSATAKVYYKKQTLFSMMYEKEALAETVRQGFAGKIYIFKPLYEAYRKELDEIVRETDFDYSQILIMG